MIDTSIQLNNHNSYKATEAFWADTFSVQTMSHITASFALYSDVVQAAANRIKIRFYTASGAIVSETNHAFAVNTIWERVSVTVAVPATAEKAQICFLAGSYWWAEAKTEEGQTATPYAINAAGQLTWISPNGIYTGTVTANQIIVSPLSGATEKDLESRLVTINSNAINLKATTENNVSRLTTIEAGQITLRSDVDGALPKITKLTSAGVYTGEVVASQITTGTLSADRIAAKSLSGAKLSDGTVTDLQIASGLSAAKITTGILKSANNYSQINLNDGTFNFGNGGLTWNGSTLSMTGAINATSGTFSGTVQAGSVINGSLNSTSGTHAGSSTGTHSGYVNSGSIKGSLSGTGGNHNGTLYSSSGTLGGVAYNSYSGGMRLQGRLEVTGVLMSPSPIYGTWGNGSDISINGTATIYAGYGFSQGSDRRLKENIEDADKNLVLEIYQLPVREFSMIADNRHIRKVGVIADEVINQSNQIAKRIISPGADGYLAADYTQLSTIAILAIQDLNKRLEAINA